MNNFLIFSHYDLVTPDGYIETLNNSNLTIKIKHISPKFIGFTLPKEQIFFNLKSTLAQIGFNSTLESFHLDAKNHSAEVVLKLIAISTLAKEMLPLLSPGTYIGKLFAADLSRRVRNPDYLMRLFGRCDAHGRPLLSFGYSKGKDELSLQKIGDRTVAFLEVKKGHVGYLPSAKDFLSTLALMLKRKDMPTRDILKLHQRWVENGKRSLKEGELLLLKTADLHIRTVFAKVANELLNPGFHHTSASILEPDTTASGNIYEFFGSSETELNEIPIEFYTLEPYQEHVFFSDRDQLQSHLENPQIFFKAFKTAPEPKALLTAAFIVKGSQLENISEKDWISSDPKKKDFPGLTHLARQALLVEKYIEAQPVYPFIKAIEEENITSQGLLLCRYFPTPLLKRMILSRATNRCLKGIYFCYPSRTYQEFFSHEDRAFLVDLAKFAIPVFWVDETTNKILQYVLKPDKDTGMFVPLHLVEKFKKATFFGIYGSTLIESNFENEMVKLLIEILELKDKSEHPLLNKDTPIALVTGGGPGAMQIGNKVAKSLNIISCGNIVDFRQSPLHFQTSNPYVEAKMTYRIDHLVERQAEFNLDFPIFVMGGIGTDFEFALEEVRRKVSPSTLNPVLLFGSPSYWREKITTRFKCNIKTKTNQGSEWVSNCFYCVQTAKEALDVYKLFLQGKLEIGPNFPPAGDGFKIHMLQ